MLTYRKVPVSKWLIIVNHPMPLLSTSGIKLSNTVSRLSVFSAFSHTKTSDLVPRVVQERNSSFKLAPNVPLLYILTSGTYCHDISAWCTALIYIPEGRVLPWISYSLSDKRHIIGTGVYRRIDSLMQSLR